MQREDFIQGLRDFADYLEATPEAPIPMFAVHPTVYANVRDENHEIDPQATKARMRELARILKPVEKVHLGGTFSLRKTFGNGTVQYEIDASRAAICRRVETGETRVIPAREERVEPVVEWVCDDPLLAG